MTDNTTGTERTPEPGAAPGRRRNAVVAAAVVAVLAIGGGTAYLVSSDTGHTTSPGSSGVALAPSPSSSTSSSTSSSSPLPSATSTALQPGGPKSTSPAGPGIVQQAVSYQATGSTLTVYFYARSCMTYTLTADESVASQVTAKVVGHSTAAKGQECSMLMFLGHATTTLKAPLNGRMVLDAATNKALTVHMGQPGMSVPTGRVTHGPVSVNS